MTKISTIAMAFWYLLPFGARDVAARAFKTALTTSIPAYLGLTAAHISGADLKAVAIAGGSAALTVVLNAVLMWARA